MQKKQYNTERRRKIKKEGFKETNDKGEERKIS